MTDLVVVGLGYIGLPTAAMFASGGLRVHGVDINAEAVASINSGQAHIFEPGLDDLLAKTVESADLRASTDVVAADAFIIAVPTPFTGDHTPDLTHVRSATESIAPVLAPGNLIILESTCPIGATEQVREWLGSLRPDLIPGADHDADAIDIAYCPERVLPGNLLHELVHNNRIVGGLTPQAAVRASDLYKRVVKGECHMTSARTAELVKLTENAFRDVNIAFANELSLVSSEVDVNVWEVIDLANLHPRVNILQPGAGVGGHCIAVDPWFIVDASSQTRLIETARRVNDAKPAWVVDRVVEAAAALDSPVIACLGLAYKPDIDDLRESPAIEVARQLAANASLSVIAAEPNIDALPQSLEGLGVEFVSSVAEAVERADVVVGLVAHSEIRALSVDELDNKVVIDPAGIFAATRGGSSA